MTAKSNAREGDGVGDMPPLPNSYACTAGSRQDCWLADQVHAYARAYAAERLAAMQAQQGAEPVAWQPIESAPKDGVRLLLALTNGAVVIGRWTDEDASNPVGPTHWQPLPAAPATGAPR